MEKRELVTRFWEAKGFRVIGGKQKDDLEGILPWLLADLINTAYRRDIEGAKCRFELKAAKKDWKNAYDAFIGEFFKAYREEDYEEVVDHMQSLEDYLAEDIEGLRTAVKSRLEFLEDEERDIAASAYIGFVLSVVAQTVHKSVYKEVQPLTRWRKEHMGGRQNIVSAPCPELDAMEKGAKVWCRHYMGDFNIYDVERNKEVAQYVQAICRGAVRWLYE